MTSVTGALLLPRKETFMRIYSILALMLSLVFSGCYVRPANCDEKRKEAANYCYMYLIQNQQCKAISDFSQKTSCQNQEGLYLVLCGSTIPATCTMNGGALITVDHP